MGLVDDGHRFLLGTALGVDWSEADVGLWVLLDAGFDLHDGVLEVLVDDFHPDVGGSLFVLGSSADSEAVGFFGEIEAGADVALLIHYLILLQGNFPTPG